MSSSPDLNNNCGAIRLELPSYVYGECSAEQRQSVEDHVNRCHGCRFELEQMVFVCSQLDKFPLKKKFAPPTAPLHIDKSMKIDDHFRQPVPGYVLLEKIGEGGIGSVYRARAEKDNSIVAVKILSPEYSKKKAYSQRFIREARAAASLRHPNLVAGFEAGIKGHLHYCVMEFVQGETVRAMISKAGKLAELDALRVAAQVASALDYAWQKRIIHRDVKPENIIVTGDSAKLMDLGLAKNIEEDITVTALDSTCGTPHYMAPEIVSGSKNITGEADVYSLGCALFEMVTGRTPFLGENGPEIMTRQLSEAPPAASSINTALSAETNQLLAEMLAKDPLKRPSAMEFIKRVNTIFKKKKLAPPAVESSAVSEAGLILYFNRHVKKFAAVAASIILCLIVWLILPEKIENGVDTPPTQMAVNTPADATTPPIASKVTSPETPDTVDVNREKLALNAWEELLEKNRPDLTGEQSEEIFASLGAFAEKCRNFSSQYKETEAAQFSAAQEADIQKTRDMLSADLELSKKALMQARMNYDIRNYSTAFSVLKNYLDNAQKQIPNVWQKNTRSELDGLYKRLLADLEKTTAEAEQAAQKGDNQKAEEMLKPFRDSGVPEAVRLAESNLERFRKGATLPVKTPLPVVATFDLANYIQLRDEKIPELIQERDFNTAIASVEQGLAGSKTDELSAKLREDLDDLRSAEKLFVAAKNNLKRSGLTMDIRLKKVSAPVSVVTVSGDEKSFTYELKGSKSKAKYSELNATSLLSAAKAAPSSGNKFSAEMTLAAARLSYLENQLDDAKKLIEKARADGISSASASVLTARCENQKRENSAANILVSARSAMTEKKYEDALKFALSLQKDFGDTRGVMRFKDEIEKIRKDSAALIAPAKKIKKLQSSNGLDTGIENGINPAIRRVANEIKNKFNAALPSFRKDSWIEAEIRFNSGDPKEALSLLNRLEKNNIGHWAITSNSFYKKRAEILSWLNGLDRSAFNAKMFDADMKKAFSAGQEAPFLSVSNEILRKSEELKSIIKDLDSIARNKAADKIQAAAEIYRVHQHDYIRAAACLEILKANFPEQTCAENGECDAELARLYSGLGLFDLAANAARDLKANAPGEKAMSSYGNALYNVAETAARFAAGDAKLSLKSANLFETLTQECPDHPWVVGGEAYKMIFETSLAGKQEASAALAMESLLKNVPKHYLSQSGDGYLKLGELYMKMNKRTQALKCFKTLKENYPNHPAVRDNKGTLINSLIRKAN